MMLGPAVFSSELSPPNVKELFAKLQAAYPQGLDLIAAIFDKYAQPIVNNGIIRGLLNEWWTLIGDHLTLDQLRETVRSGPHRGKSFLWWIAHAGCYISLCKEDEQLGDFGILIKTWKKFGNQLDISDLRVTAADGEWQGTSVLWQICYAYDNWGEDEVFDLFQELYRRFGPDLQMADLRGCAQTGRGQGISVLWLIAYNSAFRKDAILLQYIWTQFEDQLEIKDLRVRCVDNEFNNTSTVLMLILEGRKNKFLIQRIWSKFKNQLQLSDLRQRYFHMKISALWKLLSQTRFTPLFAEIVSHFKDQLQLEDWRVTDSFEHNVPALAFAVDVFEKEPQPFMSFWKKFKKQIQAGDLSGILFHETGLTIMEFLAVIAFEDSNFLASKIIEEILSQIPDDLEGKNSYISGRVHQSLATCSQKAWATQMRQLVHSRAAFFEEIRHHKATKPKFLETGHIKKLFSLAKLAEDSGYCNAYYDLAQFLLACNYPYDAYQAYNKVTSSSWRYQQAQYELAAMLIQQALEFYKERREKLAEALCFALKITQEDLRYTLINQIAYLYFNEGETKEGINVEFIPNWLIRSLSQEADIDHCFDLFKIEYDKQHQQKKSQAVNKESKPGERDVSSTGYVACAIITAYQNSLSALNELLPTDLAKEEEDKIKSPVCRVD